VRLPTDAADRIEAATGARPAAAGPLAGGCIAEVLRVELDDGRRVVAKLAPEGGLAVEGFMLRRLAEAGLPVPAVLLDDDDLLAMEFVEAGGAIDGSAQEHAAELLAALHGQPAPAFGYDRDTAIAALPQPNPRTERWVDFFRDRRLLYMARDALDAGRLPARTMGRIEALAGKLDEILREPEHPSLIHGDMWGGNVLARGGRIAAFVDPAIYWADAEVELAFSTLFSTFGEPFFRRYREIRPIAPGFFEERRDVLNLYLLLVHVRLFGGGYVGSVERVLGRFGV